MLKFIPNFITLLNLLCGCIAIIYGVHGNLLMSAFFVCLGIGFDFFDGFVARLLKVQSELGLQLDSLADAVTSGVVPGIIMYQLLALHFGEPILIPKSFLGDFEFSEINLASYLSLVGLLIPMASAYRLAKFNTDTRQKEAFIGLPTPANTLLTISLPLILKFQNSPFIERFIMHPYVLIALTFISCYLLNAEIPLFSLKFKSWKLKNNLLRYIFIILTICLLISLKFLGIPVCILIYVIASLVFSKSI